MKTVSILKVAYIDLGQITGIRLQEDNKSANLEYTGWKLHLSHFNNHLFS